MDGADLLPAPPSPISIAADRPPAFLRRRLCHHLRRHDRQSGTCPGECSNGAGLYCEVFEMAHDRHHYAGYHRSYANVQASCYILRMSRELREYIQSLRNKSYGEVARITQRSIPWHTSTANWVYALPLTAAVGVPTEHDDVRAPHQDWFLVSVLLSTTCGIPPGSRSRHHLKSPSLS